MDLCMQDTNLRVMWKFEQLRLFTVEPFAEITMMRRPDMRDFEPLDCLSMASFSRTFHIPCAEMG